MRRLSGPMRLASILFLWLAMLGSVIALQRGEHMRLTAIVAPFSPPARALTEGLAIAAVAVFLLMVVPAAWDYAADEWYIQTRRSRSTTRSAPRHSGRRGVDAGNCPAPPAAPGLAQRRFRHRGDRVAGGRAARGGPPAAWPRQLEPAGVLRPAAWAGACCCRCRSGSRSASPPSRISPRSPGRR